MGTSRIFGRGNVFDLTKWVRFWRIQSGQGKRLRKGVRKQLGINSSDKIVEAIPQVLEMIKSLGKKNKEEKED